jgi:hypothetical protein
MVGEPQKIQRKKVFHDGMIFLNEQKEILLMIHEMIGDEKFMKLKKMNVQNVRIQILVQSLEYIYWIKIQK